MTDSVAARPSRGRSSVSVALCTRNGEAYLAAQLASVLAQTVAVGEVVLSDDASTDDTVELARAAVAAAGAGVGAACPDCVISARLRTGYGAPIRVKACTVD